MIQITRAQARQLRTVLRKSLPAGTSRSYRPPLTLTAGEEGLRICVHNPEVAIEWRLPGSRPAATLMLPSVALDAFEGRLDTAVELSQKNATTVQAVWSDGGVPQQKEFEAVPLDKLPTFPSDPETFAALDVSFLRAFDDAAHTAADASVRYATTNVQLRGETGAIVGTDHRQLLLQKGFEFPWKDDLLIPSTKVFGCRDLGDEGSVAIGKGEKHVSVQTGAWKFHLLIDGAGRFPRVEHIIPTDLVGATTCTIAPDDASFLVRTLPRLPGGEGAAPVTVDLNGRVAIRAKDADQDRATELQLKRSRFTGSPVRFVIGREFLARALHLGFSDVYVTSPDRPIVCRDPRRTYVFMALDKKSAVPPSKDAFCIPSDDVPTQPCNPQRSEPTMSKPTTNGDGHGATTNAEPAQVNGDESQPSNGYGALITEAESLRDALKEAYTRSSRLVSVLRRHRKQSKIVQTTLANLRQLQEIEN